MGATMVVHNNFFVADDDVCRHVNEVAENLAGLGVCVAAHLCRPPHAEERDMRTGILIARRLLDTPPAPGVSCRQRQNEMPRRDSLLRV